MLGIGTGHIQFVARQTLMVVEDPYDLDVVLNRIAEHVGEYGRLVSLQQGKFVGHERPHAYVLQPHRIDHARPSLPQSRRRIPLDGLARQSLHHDAAQLVQVDVLLELHAVAECSRGRNHGIPELDSADLDRQSRQMKPSLRC